MHTLIKSNSESLLLLIRGADEEKWLQLRQVNRLHVSERGRHEEIHKNHEEKTGNLKNNTHTHTYIIQDKHTDVSFTCVSHKRRHRDHQ